MANSVEDLSQQARTGLKRRILGLVVVLGAEIFDFGLRHVQLSLREFDDGGQAEIVAESDLIQAIKVVSEGKAFFSPEISKVLAEDYVREINVRGAEDSYDLLTSREKEILQLLVEGRSNKDIAGLLNLSLYTVETHRRNLQSKLNLHSYPELILYGVRKGIIS